MERKAQQEQERQARKAAKEEETSQDTSFRGDDDVQTLMRRIDKLNKFLQADEALEASSSIEQDNNSMSEVATSSLASEVAIDPFFGLHPAGIHQDWAPAPAVLRDLPPNIQPSHHHQPKADPTPHSFFWRSHPPTTTKKPVTPPRPTRQQRDEEKVIINPPQHLQCTSLTELSPSVVVLTPTRQPRPQNYNNNRENKKPSVSLTSSIATSAAPSPLAVSTSSETTNTASPQKPKKQKPRSTIEASPNLLPQLAISTSSDTTTTLPPLSPPRKKSALIRRKQEELFPTVPPITAYDSNEYSSAVSSGGKTAGDAILWTMRNVKWEQDVTQQQMEI